MQNNPKNFEDAMRIARSPAGQELFRLLQNADQEKLNKAMSGAASGAKRSSGRSRKLS